MGLREASTNVAPLASAVNPNSPEFKTNAQAMASMVEELRTNLEAVHQGGGEVARQRHTSRGKLLARERIDALVRMRVFACSHRSKSL